MNHRDHKEDDAQKTPHPGKHREESAGSSTHPGQHEPAKAARSSKRPDHSARSSRGPDDKTACLKEELHEMKKQMGDMKNSLKAKATCNLDSLVHRADSPFIPRITNFPLPTRFKVPLLENFDGTKDPFDYFEAFKTIM